MLKSHVPSVAVEVNTIDIPCIVTSGNLAFASVIAWKGVGDEALPNQMVSLQIMH